MSVPILTSSLSIYFYSSNTTAAKSASVIVDCVVSSGIGMYVTFFTFFFGKIYFYPVIHVSISQRDRYSNDVFWIVRSSFRCFSQLAMIWQFGCPRFSRRCTCTAHTNTLVDDFSGTRFGTVSYGLVHFNTGIVHRLCRYAACRGAAPNSFHRDFFLWEAPKFYPSGSCWPAGPFRSIDVCLYRRWLRQLRFPSKMVWCSQMFRRCHSKFLDGFTYISLQPSNVV